MMLEDEADDEEADENDDEAADRVSCCDTVIQSEEDEDANANENENQERDEWQRQRQQQRCANRSSCYTSELATAARQSTPNASERAGGQFSCSIFASKSSSGPGNFRQAKDNNREDEEEETVPRSSSERRNSKDQDFVGDIQESNSRGGAASSGSCSDGGGGAVFEFLDGRREREFGADFKGMPVSGLRYDSFRSGGESDLKRQDATRNSGHSKRFKSDCDSCGPGTSPRQNDQMRQQSFQLSSGRGSPLGVDQVSMANKQLQHRVPSSRLATTACTTTSNYEMADNNSAGGASYKANQTGGAHAETSAVRRHYQLGTRPGLATSLAELHQASITVACPGVDAAAGDDDNDEQGEQGDDEQNGGDDDDDDELGEQTSIGRTEVAASYTNTTATASGADGSYSNEYLRLDSLSDCEARYHCRPTSSASSSSPSSAAATIGLAGGGGGGQGQLITSRQESRGQSATSTTGHQRAAPNQVFACDTARNSNPTSNGNSAQVVVVDVGTSRHCSPDATRRQPLCRRSWQPRIQQQQQQQQQLEFGAIEQQHSPRSSSRMLPVAQQQHHLSNHLHTSGSGDGEQQQQQQGQLRATFASFAGGGRIEHAPGDGRAASSCASSSSSSLRNKIFERGYEIHIIHPEPAPRQEAIESLVNQSSIGIDNKEKWYKCSTSSTDTNTSDATARLASACLEQVNKCGRGGNQDNKASRQETNSTRDAARTGSATATTGQEYRLTMMIDQSTTTTTSTKQKTTTITPAPTETMTENLKQYPPNHPLGNSKHLCAICGDRATGKHYGVFSCEGCKGFFKRTIRKDIVYVCRAQGCCLIDMRQRNRCQYCRYQKCLTCGMKREAVQEEKQRLKLRAAAAGQQQQSQLQQQQQQQQSQQHQISSDTSNNQNQNHIFNQCDTSADLSQNKLDSSTSMPHYNHYNLEATHNNNDHHHHHHHNHHHHSQLLASSSSSPPSSYRNNCNTSPHIFNATTTTPNSHNNNYDHHPLGPAAIYQQSGFGSSIAPAATTNLRPGMRINELTLKWAAQVQIECLIDWAKSVPKFTGLLIDDQVTLLRAYWNELIIAHIAFKTAEALRDGSMPGVGRHDKLNSLCIGRGIFIDAIQAHEIGLGNMFDRIIDELVVKMRDMRIDANELACLRAIILFNPESHGLKTSQPIEEYRGDIYTTLETYCRRHYEDQPNRFGKLLLRLPALRSIGLKCDSMRPYQQQQQQRRCDNNNINHHHHLVTTSTTHYNNSHHQVPRCSPTGGRGSSSPTSSSVSSISSSTSTTSSSSGMTTTASITTTTGAGAVPASYKFGYQVNLLFFGLCYEMSSIDSFLRESLTLN